MQFKAFKAMSFDEDQRPGVTTVPYSPINLRFSTWEDARAAANALTQAWADGVEEGKRRLQVDLRHLLGAS